MMPKSVETSQEGKVTILWNQQVQTDRTMPNNKTDIIIHNNEKGTCMLTDIAISRDQNVIKKEAEKILKCKNLITEIQSMWHVRTSVIPVITGATGTTSESLRKYLSNIQGKH
jgi:flagellar hook assembly protein FlgD